MGAFSGDRHRKAKQDVERWCENLTVEQVDWTAASDPTAAYNCFGFAMGRLEVWQPPNIIDGINVTPTFVWPEGVPHDWSVDAYVSAAETQGFRVAEDAAWEEGLEVILLHFREATREFTHAIRQKSPGVWESKWGSASDFEHPINGVDRIDNGRGRIAMKRRWPPSTPAVSSRI